MDRGGKGSLTVGLPNHPDIRPGFDGHNKKRLKNLEPKEKLLYLSQMKGLYQTVGIRMHRVPSSNSFDTNEIVSIMDQKKSGVVYTMAKRGRPPKSESTIAVSSAGTRTAASKAAAKKSSGKNPASAGKKVPIKLEDIAPRDLGKLKKEIKAEMYREIADFFVKQAEKLEKQLAPKK